jgi:hypothetical protein
VRKRDDIAGVRWLNGAPIEDADAVRRLAEMSDENVPEMLVQFDDFGICGHATGPNRLQRLITDRRSIDPGSNGHTIGDLTSDDGKRVAVRSLGFSLADAHYRQQTRVRVAEAFVTASASVSPWFCQRSEWPTRTALVLAYRGIPAPISPVCGPATSV